jgi:hypothetical protein
MVRGDEETGVPYSLLPHAAGMLFQQYVCDVYSRAEGHGLDWVRKNQKKNSVQTTTKASMMLYTALPRLVELPLSALV